MKPKPVVIGIGELLWDLLPSGKKAGGAPVNFAFHAGQTGAEAYAISALGDDALGDELIGELHRNKIRYRIERTPQPTGTVEVVVEQGIPRYTIREEVAWDYIPLTAKMKELAERADAVCFGTLGQRSPVSRKTIQTLLGLVHPKAYRLFDINIRQHFYSKEVIGNSLSCANALKMNYEEIDVLKKMLSLAGNEEQVCRGLLSRYDLRLVILTAGESHSTIYTPQEISTLPTPRVEVSDTIGAGDCFSGVLLTALLQGEPLKEAHRKAVDVSAHVCSFSGAWVPHRKP